MDIRTRFPFCFFTATALIHQLSVRVGQSYSRCLNGTIFISFRCSVIKIESFQSHSLCFIAYRWAFIDCFCIARPSVSTECVVTRVVLCPRLFLSHRRPASLEISFPFLELRKRYPLFLHVLHFSIFEFLSIRCIICTGKTGTSKYFFFFPFFFKQHF